MKTMHLTWVVTSSLALLCAEAAVAATATDLGVLLERGEAVTVIDIRDAKAYGNGHIRGAINIPAALLAGRGLPPLGRVVVCGDDGNAAATAAAVSALNGKAGIRAEALVGGYGAWSSLGFANTRPGGMESTTFSYLTYADLEKAVAENADLVLLDLRRSESAQAVRDPAAAGGGETAPHQLTDLAARFPGVKIERLPPPPKVGAGSSEVTPASLPGVAGGRQARFYVLVDDGDGSAEQVAHRLKAAGVGRFAILVGGEPILLRGGKAALGTTGTGVK